MNFGELQVIWNQQQEQPLFALDLKSLHQVVERKNSRIKAYVRHFEMTVIIVPLLLAVFMPLDAWYEGGGWDQYVVAGICLVVGLVALVAKLAQPKSNVSFEQTIKGMIEQSLVRIERYVRQLKWMYWGFHLPIAISAGIGLTVYSNTRTPIIWGAVLAITAISFWGTWQESRKNLQEREELKQLMEKLVEAEATVAPTSNEIRNNG